MTAKTPPALTPAEADFAGFLRSLYQGRAPEKGDTPRLSLLSSLSSPSSALNSILRSDMAKACLTFLMREGGILREALPGKDEEKNAALKKTDTVLGDGGGMNATRFHFSTHLLAYLVSIYHGKDFDPAGRSFTVSDGILVTLLLDRLYPLNGATSLISRSGYFREETTSRLICAIPFVQIHFFDRLPDGFEAVTPEPCDDADLFLNALLALTPYICRRWERIETAFWERDYDPQRIARLSRYRGRLSGQIAATCRDRNRIEPFEIFARFMRTVLTKDFYDVGRAMRRIEDALSAAVKEKLKDNQPVFRFYDRSAASYPPKYREAGDVLAGLHNGVRSWPPREVFSFYYELPMPNCRIADDIAQHLEDYGAGGQKDLVMRYVREKMWLYIKEFFSKEYQGLMDRLNSKHSLLSKEKRKEIGEWLSKFNPGSELGDYAYWMLTRRLRILLEDELIPEANRDKELQDTLSQRRSQEESQEAEFRQLIEDRFDNVYSWRSGLVLEKVETEQQVMEDIMQGYAFIESLRELEAGKEKLDRFDKKENAQWKKISHALIGDADDEKIVKPFFDKYAAMKDAIGYQIS